MRTMKNILQHELIGLECEVVDAANKSNIGVKGKIVDETMKTIVLKEASGKKAIIFKKEAQFRLWLNDKKIIIKGDHLVSRPEDRIKKKIKKW
ncbi:MAG: ribonuclease P protein component 1 [Candidatus Aenigmarchaeota archaeon]|nr:ribonuclease P protein component 1 [Candidatus Aenigmarchaeota archaeon]